MKPKADEPVMSAAAWGLSPEVMDRPMKTRQRIRTIAHGMSSTGSQKQLPRLMEMTHVRNIIAKDIAAIKGWSVAMKTALKLNKATRSD